VTRPAAAADILAATRRLSPSDLDDFLDELSGQQCVENAGWRVRRRRQGVERYPQRNAEIRARHAAGESYGQLALSYGLSRSTIAGICTRRIHPYSSLADTMRS
jgi:hypothetical protein